MANLTGKVAVISGGATEINVAIAKQFIADDAKVVAILDKNAEAAKAAVAQLGEKAVVYQCNIGVLAEVEAAFDAVKATYGEVDVLVNNPNASCKKTILETTAEEWEAVIAENVDSLFYTCKQVMLSMKERKCGKIVNIAAEHHLGAAGMVSDVVSRAAALGYNGSVCRESEKYSTTAYAVVPAGNATAEEVAKAVGFLCSEEGNFAYSQTITVRHSILPPV